MTGRLIGICVLLAWLTSPACGQTDKVILVGIPLGVSVDKSLGLTPGTSPTTDNAALLGASIANSNQLHAIYFPGKVWAFGTTVVSTNTGRNFVGNGICRLDGGDSWSIYNGTPSKIAPTITATTFNGSTVTATATGETATIAPSGITVAADDLLHTVTITGGTGFIVGKYHINSVNVGAGTWTLDRVCTTGNALGMLGSRQRTVWRDEGFGNCFEGLNFRGHPSAYTGTEHVDRAAIGWHQRTFVQDVTPNTGKTVMNKCTFTDLDVGIMFGKGLAQFPSINYIANGTLDGSGSTVPAWTLAGGALRGGAAPGSLVYTTTGAGTLTQNTGCSNGVTYSVTYTVNQLGDDTDSDGLGDTDNGDETDSVRPSLGGTNGTLRTVNGTYTEDIVCGSGTNHPLVLSFGGSGTSYVTVDNIALHSTNLAAVQDYDGKADNNADHFRGSNLHFQACDYAIVLRNSQAVAMQFDNISARHRVDTVFYVERGGRLSARGVWMSSGFPAKGPTLLRVGGAGGTPAASPGSPIVIESVVFDAPGDNLKLLEMDDPGDANGDIILRDIAINPSTSGEAGYNVPIVTVKDGFNVTLDHVGPLLPGSILLRDDDGANFKPSVTLRNCTIYVNHEADADNCLNPDVVIDKVNSTTGCEVKFEGCTTASFRRKVMRDGVYVIKQTPDPWLWAQPPTTP